MTTPKRTLRLFNTPENEMTEAKHSSGPWTVARDFGEHGQFSVLGADGLEVAAVEAWIGEHRPEATANAQLIALAPQLLERLQAIIDWADLALKLPEEFNNHGVRNLDGPVFDAARAILALAPAQADA
ncbi:MAG TPA: hypothetical protein VJP88_00510 [Caulobacteraceae bacterium]|nr:hypothetical protein [Caulobacteraceae bacterium]